MFFSSSGPRHSTNSRDGTYSRDTVTDNPSNPAAASGFSLHTFPDPSNDSARQSPRPSRVPTMSLDQLYAQAVVLDPIFRRKVEQLASGCRGCFYVSDNYDPEMCIPQLRLMEWTDIEREPVAMAGVQWSPLKQVDRAVYNVSFFLHGDVSRLTDIVRQRIVLRSLQDVASCLEAVLKDPELEVVGLQNGYDARKDASKTAGFREVVLQLKMHSRATNFFGVSSHICELQLLHCEMASLLNADRHQRLLVHKDIMFRFHALDDGRETIKQGWSVLQGLQMIRLPLWRGKVESSGTQLQRSSTIATGDQPQVHCDHAKGESAAQILRNHGVDPTLTLNSDSDEGPGQILETNVVEHVFQVLRMRCRLPGGAFDKRVRKMQSAVDSADTTMVLFTKPLGAFAKWPAS